MWPGPYFASQKCVPHCNGHVEFVPVSRSTNRVGWNSALPIKSSKLLITSDSKENVTARGSKYLTAASLKSASMVWGAFYGVYLRLADHLGPTGQPCRNTRASSLQLTQ